MDFPTKKVERILGRKHNGTFQHVTLTGEQLKELVSVGAANPRMTQNESPSIGDFLAELGDDPRVEFIGYVCWPPRLDARVSVEGFRGSGFTPGEVSAFRRRYQSADEKTPPTEFSGEQNGPGFVRFWWD